MKVKGKIVKVKLTEKDKELNKKIFDALDGLKEFNVIFMEMVTYEKTFKAKSEDELREKFGLGELEFGEEDIIDGEFQEDSLEIDEV